uniref:J domain-containing protein n=1 Tax=Glycine max TaxID=3847 RepID=A0A0R0JH39_SOYBN
MTEHLADAKKALNSLLYNNGVSKFSFEYGYQGSFSNKGQPKSGQHSGGKPQTKTKQTFNEDFDGHPEQIFQATFGNKWYTWSFNNWSGFSSEHSTSGFEWREHSNRTNKWKNESDIEHDDDDDSCVGSCSDRTVLGLPPTGPLKIEDVKNAFQLSALKWHPDKHQGPSQVSLKYSFDQFAMAEEKFKLCVNAYKTLCNALSPS